MMVNIRFLLQKVAIMKVVTDAFGIIKAPPKRMI